MLSLGVHNAEVSSFRSSVDLDSTYRVLSQSTGNVIMAGKLLNMYRCKKYILIRIYVHSNPLTMATGLYKQ